MDELLLGGGELFHLGLGFGQVKVVHGQLILRGGLLSDEALEGIVITLKAVGKGDCGSELDFCFGGFVGAAACLCGAEIVLRAEKLGAGFGELGGGILNVEFEQELALLYGLAFDGANSFDESV